MSDEQFIGIFICLALMLFILEVGMLSICDHLKDIKRLLKKKEDK